MNKQHCSPDVVEAFQRAAHSSYANKPFLQTEHATITYGTLVDMIKRLTGLYQQSGILSGDRVVIATQDDIHAPILFLSLLANGITAVVLDTDIKTSRAQFLFQIIQPKGAIVDAGLKEQWQIEKTVPCLWEVKKVENTLFQKLLKKQAPVPDAKFYPALLANISPSAMPSVIDTQLDAYILFTSGSMAAPKGVQITHNNLFRHLETLSKQFDYTENSRILNILPLTHADGMIQGAMVAFANQATLVRPMQFQIQKLGLLLDAIYKYRISHFISTPTILSLIDRLCRNQADAFLTEDFCFIISTSAYLDSNLWRNIEEHFQTRIANVYGLTETVVGGFFSGPTDADHCIGTIGLPRDCEARIVNEQGQNVCTGEIGEIWIKGKNVMKGYWANPQATAQVLQDGWLQTGDLARVDEQSFYRIIGRKKTMISCGGVKVYPEEVTEILKLQPEVMEAVTWGKKDHLLGEQIVAAVVCYPESNLTEQEIISFCHDHLEPNKIPQRIYILDSLPKSVIGKVNIEELKLISDSEAPSSQIKTRDFAKEIIQIAARCFKTLPERLNLDSESDHTSGWTSLSYLQFITDLESNFHIQFTPLEMMQIKSLRDAWKIITQKIT